MTAPTAIDSSRLQSIAIENQKMKRYALNLRFAAMTALDPAVDAGGAALTPAGLAPSAADSPAITLAAPWWHAPAFTLWGEFAFDTAAGSAAWLLALENAEGGLTLGAAIAAGEITVSDYESEAVLRFPLPAGGRFRLAISATATTLSAAVAGLAKAAVCDNTHAGAARLLLAGAGTAGLVIPHLAILPHATSAALLPVLSELDDASGSAPGINALLFPDGDPALWPDGDPVAWPG
ncbi:MAG: hypothetical protein LBC18_03335 [Opitutaceae bacterium]|jgi:hypothetical protein|nr:hypothetical protein [Opitutaceae bacterium]